MLILIKYQNKILIFIVKGKFWCTYKYLFYMFSFILRKIVLINLWFGYLLTLPLFFYKLQCNILDQCNILIWIKNKSILVYNNIT